MVSGIIAAAGRGTRMGASENKVFLEVGGKAVLAHTVAAFAECGDIDEIIIVIREADIPKCEALFEGVKKKVKLIVGGETRQESVYKGILAAMGEIVVIHDGARALISPRLISETIEECQKYKAVVLGVPAKDTIKIADKDGFVVNTPDRNFTYQIQTPQTFMRETILVAHEQGKHLSATDDAALAEAAGIPVKILCGSYENIKLTTPEDMLAAEMILERRKRANHAIKE